jgi:hypothetical protein
MSSEHDINLVTGQAGSVIAENQKVTFGTASGGITPATVTAMVGINQNVALDIEANVKASTAKLQEISANVGGVYSADQVSAATIALSTLTSLQSSLGFGGSPNQAAFGSFLSQAQNHIKDSIEVRRATDFMANTNYEDFGSGITNMSSMVERGLTSQLGSFSGAGAAMLSTGSMFNGIDIKNFSTPTGLVQSLQNNKLSNVTGVNAKLAAAGVDLNDLDNPVYQGQIDQVMGSVTDPRAINMTADQFGITNPFGGLPSYSGSDASLYNTQNALGGSSTATAGTGTTTTGFSTGSTAFGAASAPEVGNAGGIQSLKDLSDYNKLANPADTAGFSGASALATKFKDMGGGEISDASQAPGFFSSIQTVNTPLTNSLHPSLSSLMTDLQPNIDSMTGSGSGYRGLPSIRNFAQHIAGGPDVTVFNTSNFSVADISAYANSISGASSLWSTAGVDLTSPPPNSLGSSMAFATNLHKFGSDTSGSGIADVLRNMANTSTKYGESVKASLAEGNNNNLLAANGMGPLKTNPFEGAPSYQGEDSSLNTNAGARLLGG